MSGDLDSDDVIRALYFHVGAFRGEYAEIDDIKAMVNELGHLSAQHNVTVSWRAEQWGQSERAKHRAEKALHRLVVLGVVRDYTVDYSRGNFTAVVAGASSEDIVRSFGAFVSAYDRRLGSQSEQSLRAALGQELRQFVVTAASKLVTFIYEHVEQARRRSLYEMLQAASASRTDADVRRRILEYLEQSEWDERLEQVRTSVLTGVDAFEPLLSELVSPNDAAALRGAVGRMLASYPDHPRLLMIRALAEALCPDGDSDVVHQNLSAGIRFGLTTYALNPSEIGRAVGELVTGAHLKHKTGVSEVLLSAALVISGISREFVRALLEPLPVELAAGPAQWLIQRLTAQCGQLIEREAAHA